MELRACQVKKTTDEKRGNARNTRERACVQQNKNIDLNLPNPNKMSGRKDIIPSHNQNTIE
jgi:hypothetical protein